MSVSSCESSNPKAVSSGTVGSSSPAPAEKKIEYRPRPRTRRPPPTPPASTLAKKLQDTIGEIFRETHQKLEKSFRLFLESPKPRIPMKAQKQSINEQTQGLNETPDLLLTLKLLCWSSGLGTDKCPFLLKEGLKEYFQEKETNSD